MSDFDPQGLAQVSVSTDRPAHKRIVNDAVNEIARLQSELTAARDEAERLRARVAELEGFCADKIGRLPLPSDRTRFADGRYTAFREVYEEAQRLRQQADEAEK